MLLNILDTMGNEKKRILFVDDDPLIGDLYKTIFEGDYHVDLALSAEEALRAFQGNTYDFILTAFLLGGILDGHGLLTRLFSSGYPKERALLHCSYPPQESMMPIPPEYDYPFLHRTGDYLGLKQYVEIMLK